MLYKDMPEMIVETKEAITISRDGIKIENNSKLKGDVIDDLVYNLCLNESQKIKDAIFWIIWELTAEARIFPSSIQALYEAKNRLYIYSCRF